MGLSPSTMYPYLRHFFSYEYSLTKIIKEEEYLTIEPKCSKPVGIALEEILQGKINIEFEEN